MSYGIVINVETQRLRILLLSCFLLAAEQHSAVSIFPYFTGIFWHHLLTL